MAGQLLGAVLIFFGGLVNDYFARRREQRQQDREDRRQQELRDHEEKVRLQQGRLQAYTSFAEATTLVAPLASASTIREHQLALNTSYIATEIYATRVVVQHAEALYRTAVRAIKTLESSSEVWGELEVARIAFMRAVRAELEEAP